ALSRSLQILGEFGTEAMFSRLPARSQTRVAETAGPTGAGTRCTAHTNGPGTTSYWHTAWPLSNAVCAARRGGASRLEAALNALGGPRGGARPPSRHGPRDQEWRATSRRTPDHGSGRWRRGRPAPTPPARR